MVGRVEMPGGVLVLGRVAAAHMSTRETEAQVYPAISNFQTVLTSLGARCDVSYLIKMRTSLCHVLFLSDACVRLEPALILPPSTTSLVSTSHRLRRFALFSVVGGGGGGGPPPPPPPTTETSHKLPQAASDLEKQN
jgi:hypothetical protein